MCVDRISQNIHYVSVLCFIHNTPLSCVWETYPQRYVGASPFLEGELPQFHREEVPKCLCSVSQES